MPVPRGGGSPDDSRLRRRPRPTWPTGVLGDGSLLLTFSGHGELTHLSWPHVDRDPHLGEVRLSVRVGSTHQWLDAPELEASQRYQDDADILVTTLRGGGLPGEITIVDTVTVDAPVLLRQVTGPAVRVGIFVRPELYGTDRAGGGYVDRSTGVLVFHHRDRVLAVGMDQPATKATGERNRGSRSDLELAAGALVDRGVVHGAVDGAMLASTPTATTTIAIAVADDHEEAIARVVAELEQGAEAAVEDRRAAAKIVAEATVPCLMDGDAASLDQRSQLLFTQLADRATGGVIAAPEQDPRYEWSGGYGYVWPRDLAFVLLAQLASGRRDLAPRALQWLVDAQAGDGLWLQRSWTDGTLAPSWGMQLDETGAVLTVYEQAWRSLEDPALDAVLWPSMRRAADALVATLDADTGLPAPSLDLWEERVGVHAFTAAATVGGLRAAASMARRHEPGLASGWCVAADRVVAGIERYFWSQQLGRFRRSIDVARPDDAGAPVPPSYDILGHPRAPVTSVDPVDDTLDVSLLGLCYPFDVFDAEDPRMAATIAAVDEGLRAKDGGHRRYTGDRYAGGNPWVLATLWVGLTRRARGAQVPAAGIDYALAVRTATDLLPEQVDEHTGEPAWIVPLGWSHAMFALACRPDLPGLRASARGTAAGSSPTPA